MLNRFSGWLCALFLLVAGLAQGQDFNFKHFSVADGLPQSQVNAIYQDARGFVWLATAGGGVSRFDGVSYQTWSIDQGMAGHEVRCVAQVGTHMWFGTNQGVSIFDGTHFENIRTTEGLSDNRVLCIVPLDSGRALLGTEQGITIWERDTFRLLSTRSILDQQAIRDIYQDHQGGIWLAAAQAGLFRLRLDEQGNGELESFGAQHGLLSVRIRAITEDQDHRLWVATTGDGLYVSDTARAAFSPVDVPTEIEPKHYTSATTDQRGFVWFGTWGAGTICYDGKDWVAFRKANGMPDNVILSVMADNQNNIWMGSLSSGASMFLGGTFTELNERLGLPNGNVRTITGDGGNGYWIGTLEGLAHFEDGVLKSYGKAAGMPARRIGALAWDEQRNGLWIGSYESGLFFYDGRTFQPFGTKNGLVCGEIMSLEVSADGTLWIGTYKTGLVRWNGDRFEYMGKRHGLKRKSLIWSIYEDRKGHLWVGTESGVFQGNTAQEAFTPMADSVLKKSKITDIAEDDSGNIIFATNGSGLVIYRAAEDRFEYLNRSNFLHASVTTGVLVHEGNQLMVSLLSSLQRIDLDAFYAGEYRGRVYDKNQGIA
ncbi:MAG: two-component regulator propeller domain-containing protein, partial [Bacteroidota bacterium]